MAEQQKINGQQQRIPEHEADDGAKISRLNQGINDDIRQWVVEDSENDYENKSEEQN